MKNILSFLNSHASVRAFTDKPVSAEQEAEIIRTAQRSPTSSNLQAYSIISVRDDETRIKLAALCGGQEHVSKSALFLVFCADLFRLETLAIERGYPYHGESTEAFIVATVDATLAASRALMAAQAMGLGGVMVGGIRNQPDQVSQLLSLPRLVYPVMGMSLGYPVKPPRIKPRLPSAALWFREQYDGDQIATSIEEYDRTIAGLGYLEKRPVEPENYPQYEGTYSWSEHSARRMASEDPGVLRPHMLTFLRERGFLES